MKAIKVAIFAVIASIWIVALQAQETGQTIPQQGGAGGSMGAGQGEMLKLSGVWLTDDNKFSFAIRQIGNLVYAYGVHVPQSQQQGQAGAAQGGAAANTTETQGAAAGNQTAGAEQQAPPQIIIVFNGVLAETRQSFAGVGGQQGAGAQQGAAGANTTAAAGETQANNTGAGAGAGAGGSQLGLITGSFAIIPVERTILESMDQSDKMSGFGVAVLQLSDNNTLTLVQTNLQVMPVAKLTRYTEEQAGAAGGTGAGGAQQGATTTGQ